MEDAYSLKDLLKPMRQELTSRVRIKEKWIRAGFTMVPNALLLDHRISAQAKAIFAILCMHAFNKEEARISYELLQTEVSLSRPQVARYLRELRETKLIVVKRTGRANRFEIIFSQLDKRVDEVIRNLREVQQRAERRQNAG